MFVGFTRSQVGMVRHWYSERTRGFATKAWINGIGAALTFAATVIELVSKLFAGAWLVALVIPLQVLLFIWVRRMYTRIGALLAIGRVPPPVKRPRRWSFRWRACRGSARRASRRRCRPATA